MTAAKPATPPRYTERLTVPASWWVIAVLVGLTSVAAMGLYLNAFIAAAWAVLTAAAIAAFLLRYGHPRLVVDAAGLHAGECLLEWSYLGEIRPLEAGAAHERLGARADVRAFTLTRPYLTEAVEIEVVDPADPHPYWLIGTRRPQALAAALQQARPATSA